MAQPMITELARRMKLEVDSTPDATIPTWVPVRGIAEFQPKVDPNFEDDGDYDSDGWDSSAKTGMGWSLEFKVLRKTNATTSAFDPGQEVIRASHAEFGDPGMVHVRWFDRNGLPEAYEGWAQTSWSPDGGGRTSLDTVTVSLKGNGKRVEITNPVAHP